MKIKSIKIEGYRSLKNIDIQDLKNINVFHGDNNTGKSNILKSLDLFFSPKKIYQTMIEKKPGEGEKKITKFSFVGEVELTDSDFYNFGEKEISFSIDIEMKNDELSKIINKYKETIEIKLNKSDKNLIRISAKISYPLKEDPETHVKNGIFELTSFIVNSINIFGNSNYADLLADFESYLMRIYININCERKIIKEIDIGEKVETISHDNLQKFLYNLYLSDKVKERNILKEIKKKFSDINKDIGEITFCTKSEESLVEWGRYKDGIQEKTIQKRKEIKLMIYRSEENIMLPVENIGSGIQQSLMIISNIVANKNSYIYGIEELEANLSPTSQTILFSNIQKMMKEKNFGIDQIFITSHSNVFSKKNIEDASVYMVEHDGKKTSVDISSFKKIIKFFAPYQTYFEQRFHRFLMDNNIKKEDKMEDGQLATCFFSEEIFKECDQKDSLYDSAEMEKIFEQFKKEIGKKYIIKKNT